MISLPHFLKALACFMLPLAIGGSVGADSCIAPIPLPTQVSMTGKMVAIQHLDKLLDILDEAVKADGFEFNGTMVKKLSHHGSSASLKQHGELYEED